MRSASPGIRLTIFTALVIALLISSAGCESVLKPTPIRPGSQLTPNPATSNNVFFSNPTDPQAGSLRGGPDLALSDAIRQARLSVDLATFDLELWSIRDALLDAHRRGLKVRLVTDSDNLDRPEIQALVDAGIPVLGDRREGLMHHKFAVLDRQDVWSGSMNLTLNSAYRNNDNLIHLRSDLLAENYTTEFEEMFVDDLFGSASLSNTPRPDLVVDGMRVQNYFSPDDGVEAEIIKLIRSAREQIDFMEYSFTSDKIAQALIERADAGVQVRGILEEAQVQSNTGTEYDRLRSAGLDVHLDGNPKNMHHKVIIIDGQIVITGSYNLSRNAETNNDENILVIHAPKIAAQYLAEFEKLFGEALP